MGEKMIGGVNFYIRLGWHPIKTTRHSKEQEDITHNEINKSIKTNLEVNRC